MSDAAEPAIPIPPGAPVPPWCTAAWRLLATRAAGGTLPHALLLAGPAGLGKRALADAFVRARLCEAPDADGHACGTCRACRLLAAGTHPDRMRMTFEVNPKTHVLRKELVVDQVRAISARLAMASQLGGWQVAVIDPADRLNPAAQNALLKTLEEPNADSLIVLVADQPQRLVATIRSRCQRIDFAPPPAPVALTWLQSRGIGGAGAGAALNAAGGNPGQAWLLATGGGMERRQAVARDLLALSAGRADPRALSRAWAGDEPDARLDQAVRLLEGALRARAAGTTARFDPDWRDTELLERIAGANRVRGLLASTLKTDLLLFAWLAGSVHPGGAG